ncbi:hypothetical protein GCM10025785_00080 [Corynebacterium canis]
MGDRGADYRRRGNGCVWVKRRFTHFVAEKQFQIARYKAALIGFQYIEVFSSHFTPLSFLVHANYKWG